MTFPRDVIADLELVLGVRSLADRDQKPPDFGPGLPFDAQDEALIGMLVATVNFPFVATENRTL